MALLKAPADRFFALLQIFDACAVGGHQPLAFCIEHLKEFILNACEFVEKRGQFCFPIGPDCHHRNGRFNSCGRRRGKVHGDAPDGDIVCVGTGRAVRVSAYERDSMNRLNIGSAKRSAVRSESFSAITWSSCP